MDVGTEISAEMSLEVLSKLRQDQATGPDNIGARPLKEFATVLAGPVADLTNAILKNGQWPNA